MISHVHHIEFNFEMKHFILRKYDEQLKLCSMFLKLQNYHSFSTIENSLFINAKSYCIHIK